ncbi:hypothetical protein C798_09080 [Herbaspirillum rubrisubalbicans Os34]|uniref:Uncharacterized protein n=1 Tax=Herbaspirillum rubrisubalbicans Os34 TaxID=1235827 RepID=A0A6M3ZP68_9BURK|nr:hypothetical protein C798_09080 [Herbaspirillum rubrisubalbicans Os34]
MKTCLNQVTITLVISNEHHSLHVRKICRGGFSIQFNDCTLKDIFSERLVLRHSQSILNLLHRISSCTLLGQLFSKSLFFSNFILVQLTVIQINIECASSPCATSNCSTDPRRCSE